MAQTTSLVFNGGSIPSPAPAPTGSGKAKLLKIGETTITEQGVQVTKKVICDPDSVTTVAPFMEVLTSAKLAELVETNSIIVLDDGDMQYLMANANITVEEGISVCTAVNFLGLSQDKRAKVAYNCTRVTDELTLQQVVEVGEPVETDFNLVIADSEDTAPNTLIDKMEVVGNEREPDEPTILQLETTVDGQGNRKVAINEDSLRTFVKEVDNAFEDVWDSIGELPNDEHGYFNSSLYTTPGDGTTESILMDNFRISQGRDVHGNNIEFMPTHHEDGVDFGEVYLNPGTYILNVHYTLQYVGNPRGTFHPIVTNVGEQSFDFSYEHEDILRTTRIVTRTTRGKFALNFPFDADTPPMCIWVKHLEIAQIASYTNTAVVREATQDWLDEHPEATTTVQDGSLTEQKFSNGLKLKAIKDYVTPEMFGAVGDGVTDDTAAINSALASLPNGGTLVLTSKYALSATLQIEHGIVIVGISARSCGFVCIADITALKCSDYPYYSEIVLKNFSILGYGNSSNDSVGIFLDKTNLCIIDTVYVERFNTGIKLFTAVNTAIYNIFIGYCQYGIYGSDGSYNARVFGGMITACGVDGIYGTSAFTLKCFGTDIEACDHAAVCGSLSFVGQGMHIEGKQTSYGFVLTQNASFCVNESFMTNMNTAFKTEGAGSINGRLRLSGLTIAACTTDIDAPSFYGYDIDNIRCLNSVGGQRTFTYNLTQYGGLLHVSLYTGAQIADKMIYGEFRTNKLVGTTIYEKELRVSKKIYEDSITVSPGTISANAGVEIEVALPANSPSMVVSTDVVCVNESSFDSDFVVKARVKDSSHLAFFFRNLTNNSITVNDKVLLVYVIR